ncbi:lectin like domain-containing protein [Methanobrevibacter sp.]|uniref:lectin like domain-containing protein n=1 Tax=Methanobrevibacter sp. TaxID=66852 RepID=UPI003890DD4B
MHPNCTTVISSIVVFKITVIDRSAHYPSSTTIALSTIVFKITVFNITVIYSNSSSIVSSITDKGNIVFNDNISSRLNGLYSTKYINFYVNSSNYIMVVADTSNYNGTLPSRFSLIDNGWVTPVKKQIGGTCWDYANVGAIESALVKATGVVYDLSENNLKNVMGIFSDSGDIRYVPDDGWYTSDTHEYLASWYTLVSEDLDPAVKGSSFSPNFNNELIHIQNVAFASKRNATDNDAIKEALMKYGGVLSSMRYESKNFNGNSYYYNGSSYCNHAVVIVGWDDNYSKNNFKGDCPGDGAWIIRNAEGPKFKDNGYFYISYYDTKIAYTSQYFIFNDTVRFDRNYQHDYIIDSWKKISKKFAYYKNVYRSVANEELLAFSTFFKESCDWEVSIYVGDKLKYSQTGKAMSKGYFTFNFDNAVNLSKGDEFSIVLKVSNGKSTNYIPINNKNNMVTTTGDRGISYYSIDGKNWKDLDNDHQVACLKVFSRNIEVNSNMAVATTTT